MNVIKKGKLRWFRRVERMNEDRSVMRIHDMEVNDRKGRGRLSKIWHDQVNHLRELGHVESRNNRRVMVNY